MRSGGDRLAVVADIHGNSDALRAVLDDMARLGVSEAVNLGDHFSGPLDTPGTATLLRQQTWATVRGNHDRILMTLDPEQMAPSDRVAYDQLSPADLDWLRELPATMTVRDDILLCHATPASDSTYWLEQVFDDGSIGPAGKNWVEAQAAGVSQSLILCAHTHTPRAVRLSDGRLVVNPGSVGCPGYDDDLPRYHVMQTGTPAACYAIVERLDQGWSPTFRQVPYDPSAMAALAEQRGRAEWARAVATGWVDS